MSWNLLNTSLPSLTTFRNGGLELFEMGSTQIHSPLFKVNPLAQYGSENPNTPGSGGNSDSTGYTPVIDTTTPLVPSSTISAHKIPGNWDISGHSRITDFTNIAASTFLNFLDIEDYYTYVFASSSSFSATSTLGLIVPRGTSQYTFSFDLTPYSIDTVNSVNVQGLPFLTSGTSPQQFQYVNGVLTLYAKASCRPFAGQNASISTSSTISSFLVKLEGLVFDLTSLNLDYVDAITYQNKTYYFTLLPESGGLTYNRNTKLAYIWL